MTLLFEAAVAGGIPIVKTLREGLAGQRIDAHLGILNGTCNYILTDDARARARLRRGAGARRRRWAMPRPTRRFDIDGIDAAHKLAILAALGLRQRRSISPPSMSRASATSRALDIAFADELGYRIKLLGIARRTDDGLEQRVHPCMVPARPPIASVDGVFNAVVVEGDFVGRVYARGPRRRRGADRRARWSPT